LIVVDRHWPLTKHKQQPPVIHSTTKYAHAHTHTTKHATNYTKQVKHDISFMHVRRFPQLQKVVNREHLPDTQAVTRRRRLYVAGSYANTANAKNEEVAQVRLHPDLFKNVVYESDLSKCRAHMTAKMKRQRRQALEDSVGGVPLGLPRRRRNGGGGGNGSSCGFSATNPGPTWRVCNPVEAREYLKSELHTKPLSATSGNDYGALARSQRRDKQRDIDARVGPGVFYGPTPSLAKDIIKVSSCMTSCNAMICLHTPYTVHTYGKYTHDMRTHDMHTHTHT
jgi:hypothetical protein